MAKLDKNIGQAGNLTPKVQSNFIKHEKRQITGTTILRILIICIVVGAVSYFGIFSRYQEINKLQAEVEDLKEQNEIILASVDQKVYNEVNKEYMSYNREFIEKIDLYKDTMNRVDLLTRIEDMLTDKCTISKIVVSKNSVSFTVTNVSNRSLANICEFLGQDTTHGIVNYQTSNIKGAEGSDGAGESLVTCTLKIDFKDINQNTNKNDSKTSTENNGGNE